MPIGMSELHKQSDADENGWVQCDLYMGGLRSILNYDILDVVMCSVRPKKLFKPLGTSNEELSARNALAADPYNLRLIIKLGHLYAKKAKIENCHNVLLRGWKRAGEIEDVNVRFCFLLKLCEVSLTLRKYRQAFAVLHDIQEPEEDGEYLNAYLVISVQVHAINGDQMRALKMFQRAIEGKEFDVAVRIWALVQVELKKAGGYEAAKSLIEKRANGPTDQAHLQMLEQCSNIGQNRKPSSEDQMRKWMMAGVVVLVAMLVYFLSVLEAWSLASLKKRS
mmetsp:Transcript_47451/g.133968  ORF Transcript_47451/g.133968 Transcript_47451/m.133968 type:complete len:279 (+) Transcript_47451:30-866(+)